MTKKYYYDCPIQALYMNKEFGVQFYTSFKSDVSDKKLGFHVDFRDIFTVLIELLGISKASSSDNKIYVAPESKHIFELKNDDFGIVKNFNPLIFVRFCSYYNSWGYEGDKYEERFNNDEVNIIYRNGKHFFNPKEEN